MCMKFQMLRPHRCFPALLPGYTCNRYHAGTVTRAQISGRVPSSAEAKFASRFSKVELKFSICSRDSLNFARVTLPLVHRVW